MQPILSGRSARKFQLCSSASALVMTAALVSASPAVAGVFTTGDVLGNPSLNDPFLVVGANASGLVAINGGSIVMTAGGARVGGNSATGNGSVSVLDPGSEWRVGGNNGSSLEVGINGGTGFVGIGNGAKVITSATPTGDAFVYGKFVQIGNSGNGSMAITSGGSLVIEDSLDSGGGETLNIGGGYVGPGTGSLSVTGASSLVRVEGNGAGVSIGYGAGATGTAQFTAGAALQLDGGANGATIHVGQNGGFGGLIVNNATIATTSQNYNVISIGENNGSGTVSVLAGGVVSLQNTGLGQSANINVGTSYAPSGSAQFTVDGGQVNLSGDGYASLYVGTDAPNLAIATITGASSNVNLTGRGANITAGRDGKSGSLQVINGATVNATASEYSAFLGVGSQGGSGAAQISSGAVVHLTGTGTANADVNVGDRYTGGGTGSLALLSGGQLVLNTAKTASVTIGTDVGSADMRIDGAGSALDMTGKRTQVNVGSYNPSPNPGGSVSGELFMGSGGSLTMNAGTDGSGLDIGAGSLGGAGRMQVFHMAQVQIDSAAQSNINVGANGGQGALTIFDSSMTAAAVKSSSLTIGRHNGSGSVTMLLAGQLNLSNTDSAFASGIDVGTSYSPSGNAELNVGSGSDVNVTSAGSSFFNVGSTPPNLAIATIAGAGSSVTLNGPGTHATVGGNGTNGRMTLSDGAAFTANASAGNAFFGVGLQNGTGAVSIVNGAAMALNSTGAGNSDFNVGGRFSGAGAGSVYVGSGGVLSLSSAANSFVNVSSDGSAGRAVLNVDGPFSKVTAAGQNASVHVGTLHSGSTIGGSASGMLTISNGAALDIAGQANGARLSIGAGTLGGYGSVNLINGGSIKMDSAGHSSIGVGSAGSSGMGAAGSLLVSNSQVSLSGANGSSLTVGHSGGEGAVGVYGSNARLDLTNHFGSTSQVSLSVGNNGALTSSGSGSVRVQAGGQIALFANGASDASINVGSTTGQAEIAVTDGLLRADGRRASLNIGDSGRTGTMSVGSLGIATIQGRENGAFMAVGNSGGAANLALDGKLFVVGQGGATGSVEAVVGRSAGSSGSVTITSGGLLQVSSHGTPTSTTLRVGDGGGAGRIDMFGGGVQVLTFGDNAAATLNVGTGTGSNGTFDSSGTITVQARGFDANASATFGSGTGASGVLELDGATMNVVSDHGFTNGNFGFGGGSNTTTMVDSTFNVLANAGAGTNKVATIVVGSGAGSSGSVDLVNSQFNVASANYVANLQLGVNGGVGAMTINETSSVNVTAGSGNANVLVGFNFGTIVAGTSGTLIVNGGEFTASNTSTDSNSRADLLLGLNGSTGRLEVRDGGTVTTTADAGQGRIGLLGATSAAATILVDGAGSLVEASDYIGIGAGGASPRYGTVLLANGGCIKAPTVEIFAGSLLGGIGCVQGNVINNGGFVVPGSSPGTLDIFGDYTQTGGTIDIEVNGFAPGQYDVLNVSGNTSFSNVVFRFIFGEGAQYLSGSSFDFINVAGSLSFSDIQYEYLGTPQGLETAITFSPDGFGVVFSGDVAGVPVPGAAALFGLGLFGLGALRRRRTVPEKVAA